MGTCRQQRQGTALPARWQRGPGRPVDGPQEAPAASGAARL